MTTWKIVSVPIASDGTVGIPEGWNLHSVHNMNYANPGAPKPAAAVVLIWQAESKPEPESTKSEINCTNATTERRYAPNLTRAGGDHMGFMLPEKA